MNNKSTRRHPELPHNHPLNICNPEGGQYKEALKEYNATQPQINEFTQSNDLTQQNGFIVLQRLMGSFQPVFKTDESLMFFVDEQSARLEIKDAIDSVADAVAKGDMDDDSEMTNDDYVVIPATIINPAAEPEKQTILCVVDGQLYRMQRSDDDFIPVTTIQSIHTS